MIGVFASRLVSEWALPGTPALDSILLFVVSCFLSPVSCLLFRPSQQSNHLIQAAKVSIFLALPYRYSCIVCRNTKTSQPRRAKNPLPSYRSIPFESGQAPNLMDRPRQLHLRIDAYTDRCLSPWYPDGASRSNLESGKNRLPCLIEDAHRECNAERIGLACSFKTSF